MPTTTEPPFFPATGHHAPGRFAPMTHTLPRSDHAPAATRSVAALAPGQCGRKLPVVFRAAAPEKPLDPASDTRRIVDAAVSILVQGEALLGRLSPESYSR